VPKATNLFNNAWEKRTRKNIDYTRKVSQGHLLTSSGETADSWASRATLASLELFDRLMLRVTGTFFTEALVVLGAISCAKARQQSQLE
jgi:hypothetical protein